MFIKMEYKQKKTAKESGQLLLEVLVAIAAAAIIVTLGSQMVYVSLKSGDSAGKKNIALGLSGETFEAVRNSAVEKWQNLYNLNKDGTNYYPTSTAGKWAVATGTENIVINDVVYTRFFIVQNVCRDDSTRNITGITDSNGSSTTACVASGGNPDPSTQKVSVTVSWLNADPINSSEYVARWRNKACVQTTWSGTGSGTTTCPATTYGGQTNIDFSTAGSLKLAPQ